MMKTTQIIDYKELFESIVKCFRSSPQDFISSVKKSHHLPKELPSSFPKFNDLQKSNHIFAFFGRIFAYEELEKFVRQPNFQEESIEKSFSGDTPLLFKSVCYLYRKLLLSMEDDLNTFNKYAPDLALTFGKLLVPENRRHLDSTDFHLDHIYISPIYFTNQMNSHRPSILKIDEDGVLFIHDANDGKLYMTITQKDFTGMIDDEKLFFFDVRTLPSITIEFPSPENATDAFVFSLTPPKRGFMQMSSFLHSISAFKSISTFFEEDEPYTVPSEFIENLQKCIRTTSMELLLYEFVIPANEVKVSQSNMDFYLDAIGDDFLPFARALVQLNWMMTPFGGQLILRQNSQLTSLCRVYLRLLAGDYLRYINTEMKKIVNTGGPLIKSLPISDETDAITFIKKVFKPIVELLLNSIPKMPTSLRCLLRILFVRCAGFYVNQSSPFLVVPNLMLLRFLIPPFTEESVAMYRTDVKMSKLSQLASSSLLSLFYQLGWTEDKEPVLAKYSSAMEKYYPKVEKFVYKVMDCQEFHYDSSILKPQGDIVDLVSGAAERVILMNLNDPNKVIHTHPYCVSLMQMVEEYTFDFTVNGMDE
ncbi:hypothetical protein TRFO_10848 [Tritrichomonas foetus]|uniref:Ras-GAP domain-containing protein n=1 Tax=Tritrichomonas foetus TaxID=1144522 RepID=A0A1J4JBW3_9EUKA|nr:hypothetical protein TRFO_10848 [Tritrichomonas foetus]|eukprot:OHS94901.1 hypothetical protein TRFO_10848 [Tritrichomonas foetus]